MTMAQSYDTYFASHTYRSRYPAPNRLTLERLQQLLEPGATVLDVGAGDGRYAIPLAVAGFSVLAVERSEIAREQLLKRIDEYGLHARITVFPTVDDVPQSAREQVRHLLLLFGVLGHMTSTERTALFAAADCTMPALTSVVGSVPNRYRRFRFEQEHTPIADAGAAPRFLYERRLEGVRCAFEYTAFSPRELRVELSRLGWMSTEVTAESLTAEENVARHPALGRLDRLVSQMAPPRIGYGLFFHATRHAITGEVPR